MVAESLVSTFETTILLSFGALVASVLFVIVANFFLANRRADAAAEAQQRQAEQHSLALQSVTGINNLNAVDRAQQSSVQEAADLEDEGNGNIQKTQ
jgi:biopolymer transport protein ExbB/TolQ